MGQTALLPFLAGDFFALKNPTASAGFEPANLGTKDQHATSRPPKPRGLLKVVLVVNVSVKQENFTIHFEKAGKVCLI